MFGFIKRKLPVPVKVIFELAYPLKSPPLSVTCAPASALIITVLLMCTGDVILNVYVPAGKMISSYGLPDASTVVPSITFVNSSDVSVPVTVYELAAYTVFTGISIKKASKNDRTSTAPLL